ARFMELKGRVKEWPEALREAARSYTGLAEWREFRRAVVEAEELAAQKGVFLEKEAEMEI
ncbi:hypothetical protein KEM55_002586, partial [Ascosphaera atra]